MVLWVFGVPLAMVFGFLEFLLNFIPNIGPLIGCALPVPFLILNSSISPTAGIICFVLIATIQFVSGNVIETRIMGKSFGVSPIKLLLALMFFGPIWASLVCSWQLQSHRSSRSYYTNVARLGPSPAYWLAVSTSLIPLRINRRFETLEPPLHLLTQVLGLNIELR